MSKIPKFHLISRCRNFVETQSFAEFWANRRKLCKNCAFPKTFRPKKLGEITVFYAMSVSISKNIRPYMF